VLLLEAAANANVEVLAPPVVLTNAISAIAEGSGVPEFAVPITRGVRDVEGDELPDPARAEVRAGTGAVVAMIPVMLGHANASALVLIAAANDDAPLLVTCVNGVGGSVPVIPEMAADVNASVVASRATENEVLLCEAAANADVEGPVPSAILVEAISATFEGPEVPVFATPAMLEVDGDELLDSSRTDVLVSTGADVAIILVVINHVDACRRGPTAVADANIGGPLLKTFADGVGETVPVIPEVLDHVDTLVAAACVVVNDVLLLEAAADENMEACSTSRCRLGRCRGLGGATMRYVRCTWGAKGGRRRVARFS